MRLTITPRDGTTPLEFFAPDAGGYIRLESPGYPGTLGRQICAGGGFQGSTLTATTEADFKATCRKWYRAYRQGA